MRVRADVSVRTRDETSATEGDVNAHNAEILERRCIEATFEEFGVALHSWHLTHQLYARRSAHIQERRRRKRRRRSGEE